MPRHVKQASWNARQTCDTELETKLKNLILQNIITISNITFQTSQQQQLLSLLPEAVAQRCAVKKSS